MDKLFNISPKETEKKPTANYERAPEKLTDEQKSKLSNAFYGCDVFNKEQVKPSEPVRQQQQPPVAPATQAAAPVQPAAEVEPEVQKPTKPEPIRCSLDDLFNDNSLDDMERSSNPKKNNNSDDSIQTFKLQ